MKSNDNVGVTFINTVLGAGRLNGVVNVQLGTALFSLVDEGKIDNDVVVSCRLRMDIQCATLLRNTLDSVINNMNAPSAIEPQTPSSTENEPTVDAARLN
jgi:hypothetical protein